MKPKTFDFEPASFVPFRDKEAVRRVRAIKREDITRHPNPELPDRGRPGRRVRGKMDRRHHRPDQRIGRRAVGS